MLITAAGVLIRMAIEDISKTGRSTQGVKLIRLESIDNEYVSTVAIVEREEEKETSLEEDEDEDKSIDITSETEQTPDINDEEE